MPLVALAVALACAEAPTPPAAQPTAAVTPQAQPATAVRLLLEHGDALELSPKQRDKLQVIDRELEATNAPLATKLHEIEAHPRSGGQASPDRPAGGSSGAAPGGARMGMGGGGRRGGGRGRSGGRGGGAGSSATAAKRPHDSEAENVRAQMQHNHEAALGKAFDVLDLEQRARARQLLDDSDFEPPAEPGDPAPGDPAAR